MADVLNRLGRSELSYRVRWAALRSEADLRAGRPWIASLARHRLIRPVDAAVLASAERVGNLAWSLRERADALDRRRVLRRKAIALVLQPLSAIALGGLVLLVALVYFWPLIAMLNALVDAI
jgi:type II secretory pathway component PulF